MDYRHRSFGDEESREGVKNEWLGHCRADATERKPIVERIVALDGVRAIAIAMVVAYHVDKSVVPAGHWGVPMFFVLSGFVITGSICAEIDRSGRLDLSSFYRKRLLRIVPALVAVCACLLVVGATWPQVIASAGLHANYARIAGLDLDRLTHTWFVAVVAQFYLLWPLVMAAIPARRRPVVVGALMLVALVWRALAIEFLDPGWVYNATDTNAAALIVGAFLAVAEFRAAPRGVVWAIPAMLALTLVPGFGDNGALVLWGGFVAVALSALVLLHAMTSPTWLQHRVLVRIGEVSFGIFLWHYVFIRSNIPLWVAVIGTAVATAASWHLLERPLAQWDARRRPAAVEATPAAAVDVVS